MTEGSIPWDKLVYGFSSSADLFKLVSYFCAYLSALHDFLRRISACLTAPDGPFWVRFFLPRRLFTALLAPGPSSIYNRGNSQHKNKKIEPAAFNQIHLSFIPSFLFCTFWFYIILFLLSASLLLFTSTSQGPST